jgi:hypothetical protein
MYLRFITLLSSMYLRFITLPSSMYLRFITSLLSACLYTRLFNEKSYVRNLTEGIISMLASRRSPLSSLKWVIKLIIFLNVCGSVHLGNICFIQIQLDVQYSFFLKSFFLLHFSDVTCIHRQEHNCSVQPWLYTTVVLSRSVVMFRKNCCLHLQGRRKLIQHVTPRWGQKVVSHSM